LADKTSNEHTEVENIQVNLGDFDFAGDDAVVPFQVEGLDVRGRAVQLGASIDGILKRHNYPEEVARLLAEATVLTVLLGTSLKFEGKFIFQTQSDGPVDMLVVDFRTPRSVRGTVKGGGCRPQDEARGTAWTGHTRLHGGSGRLYSALSGHCCA